jgi:hypothetical protein
VRFLSAILATALEFHGVRKKKKKKDKEEEEEERRKSHENRATWGKHRE